MTKQKLVRGLKIGAIVFLSLAIFLVSFLHWKSDFIIRKVLSAVQDQLTDSLHYENASLDVFSHFPCVAVELDHLHIGSGDAPFIDKAAVDIVIRLFPLFKDAIDIQRIEIDQANIDIQFRNGKWSYDILKKSEEQKGKPWSTLVRQISMTSSVLYYDDGKNSKWKMNIRQATGQGIIDPKLVDLKMEVEGMVEEFSSTEYQLSSPLDFQLTGLYSYDLQTGAQQIKNWKLSNDGVDLVAEGNIIQSKQVQEYDLRGQWSNAKPEILKKWFPETLMSSLKDYSFFGESEGKFSMKGKSTVSSLPDLFLEGTWKNGGFSSPDLKEDFKNLDVQFVYHTAEPEHKGKSTLQCTVEKNSTFGDDFRGVFHIVDLEHPVADMDMKGSIDGALINMVSSPIFTFQEGHLDIEQFEVRDLNFSKQPFHHLLNHGKWHIRTNDVKSAYLNNPMSWSKGEIKSDPDRGMQFSFGKLTWDKATAEDFSGEMKSEADRIRFSFGGKFCEGKIESTGSMTTSNQQKIFQADWKVKDIQIQQLFSSFSNFDQTFITNENLSGKANVWAETTIPMDADWKIKTKEVVAKSAIEIHVGRLKNLKTLEDFGDYVHVEDLRDIRFNELRNYLKIEGAKVYLPVMFLQSSAMNMSISGVHGFDQHILYNLKLNAGQAMANKLKRTDFRKEFKSARKSGWINMYFVLEGTTADVKYQQYRLAVLAGFEQSAQLKESLRKELVDHFGYDVYWLEPNEWEDVPEYK